MEKSNTGVRVTHLVRLNPAAIFFLGLFAFMIQPEVQIISDVGMIRKATNRYPEINILSNRKAPSVYGTLGSLMKDALSVLDHLLTAVSLSGSPEYERNA